MHKRVCTTVLAVLMALAAAGSALAADISPFWINMIECEAKIKFSGTTAICSVSVDGKPITTYVEADIELQEKEPGGSYEVIARWPNRTASGSTLDWSESFPGALPPDHITVTIRRCPGQEGWRRITIEGGADI